MSAARTVGGAHGIIAGPDQRADIQVEWTGACIIYLVPRDSCCKHCAKEMAGRQSGQRSTSPL